MAVMRKYEREFKIGAVNLIKERGVTAASQALEVRQTLLRRWLREFSKDPQRAFPGKGNPSASRPATESE